VRPLPLVTPLSHLCGPAMLPGVEVSHPKAINIKQYLSTDNFSVNNRHLVIKSSQTTQLYFRKVIYKHFSCHHHIKHNFVTNLFKINIFWFSSILRLNQDPTRRGPDMLPGLEVSRPKTINIKQYLSTNNFPINNRHFVIKHSQTTQIYTTKVFYKHFSCHHHIKHNFCNKSFKH
jgi:hypothetical protein